MEQRLYAQVVMIRRKGSDNKKERGKTKKYNSQGQSARSILWFDIDHKWFEENVSTCETNFYKIFIK